MTQKVPAAPPSLGPERIPALLVGMPYPAQRWQLVVWADYNGGGAAARAALLKLPERTYRSLSDVLNAAAQALSRGTGPSVGGR